MLKVRFPIINYQVFQNEMSSNTACPEIKYIIVNSREEKHDGLQCHNISICVFSDRGVNIYINKTSFNVLTTSSNL